MEVPAPLYSSFQSNGCKEKGKYHEPRVEKVFKTEADLQVSWQCNQRLRKLLPNIPGDVERIRTLFDCMNIIGLCVRNNNRKHLEIKIVVKETLKSKHHVRLPQPS